jgi:2-polyprenyl-6-methoxyphenol hydroxylase-like FAD-dependent oxidoreductase
MTGSEERLETAARRYDLPERVARPAIAKRHEVAANVVALTDRMTRVATMRSPTGQALRNIAVAFAGHLPPVRAALARTLADLERRHS